MQKNMELKAHDLDFILNLHNAKTLTAAAKNLGVEQSTLSRQLSMLEERIGKILFSRHRNGLHPSAYVTDLIPLAEKMEVIVRRANQQDHLSKHEPIGEVHVSCPEAIADLMFAPRIHELFELHKGIRLKITATAEMLDLDRLDCDIALRIGKKPTGDVVGFKLHESTLQAFGHPKFLPLSGEATIQDLPIIKQIDLKSEYEVQMQCNRMTTCMLAAEAGAGVVFIPESFGNTRSNLVKIPIKNWPSPKVEIYLISPRAVRKLKHVDAVWVWIKEVFKSQSEI